ncbi:YihY/virulence factor BrkB family protein [Thiofilum flexile]|uniref:YihY/virulence factor BrkB family protein n=1 Tax=Thiofilum flexile TaxID=125627 RepID=UPI00038250AE|nr:YihY/virulence factor BrkB family protein [Thiofilum flexile]
MIKPISFWLGLRQVLLQVKYLVMALTYDIYRGQIMLRATGLVYTTLLSLVPLLALGFSVLKGFGVHNQLEPLLIKFLAPLGDKASGISNQVLAFVDNVKVGVLGIVGFTILLYTVVGLLRQVEDAFNYVWDVEEGRSLLYQVRDYLGTVFVGPIIAFSAFGIWGAIQETSLIHELLELEYLAGLWGNIGLLIPTLILMLGFFIVFMLMPNTKVHWEAALGGAAFAAVTWQVAGYIFAVFVVSSGQQTAIYSIFAGLFLLMLWMYLGWLIVLVGARLAYYLQYPNTVKANLAQEELTPYARAGITLDILIMVTQRFINGQNPISYEEVTKIMPHSRLVLNKILIDLKQENIVYHNNLENDFLILLQDPRSIKVSQLIKFIWYGANNQTPDNLEDHFQNLHLELNLPNISIDSTIYELSVSDSAK